MSERQRPGPDGRLLWLDTARGLSILWIAFFHFLISYDNGRYPWPLSLASFPAFVQECAQSFGRSPAGCIVEGSVAGLFQRGPHAVGVFLVLSGFGLTFSVAKAGGPKNGWARWYRRRFLRLFPLYWAAHLVYLFSPFVRRPDPVDYRFILSFLGDRIFPVETVFYYANPAWWFFGLLLELCLVFPLLFRLLQKAGPFRFLALSGLATILSRYLLVEVIHAHGNYVQGAFFGARLFEFAAGMVLAVLYRRSPAQVESRLFSWPFLGVGIVGYVLGVACYRPGFALTLSDGLTGVGLCIVLVHVSRWVNCLPALRSALPYVGAYSYGIYLLHQPYVMAAGERLKGFSMPVSVTAVLGILVLIVAGASWIERSLDRLIGRLGL